MRPAAPSIRSVGPWEFRSSFPPYATVGPPKTLTSYVNEVGAADDLAKLYGSADGALVSEIG